MHKPLIIIAAGFAAGLAASACDFAEPDQQHCAHSNGKEVCADRFGSDRPYCTIPSCDANGEGYGGCVAEEPSADCNYACGGDHNILEDGSCLTDGDGDGDGDGDPTGDGDGDGDGDTGPQCMSSDECDSATPLCDNGICVSCDAAATATVTCASDYPDAQVCDASSGQCVQCTTEEVSACPSNAPACEDNTCVPCSSHDQCPGSACDLEVGSCFDSATLHVNGDADCNIGDGSDGMPYCTIKEAVTEIGAGAGVVILHEADASYNESITVAGAGTTVVFIAAPGDAPVWENDGTASLRADTDARVFAHGIVFRGSTNSAILISTGGKAYVTSCKISLSSQAGISVSDGTLFLQNSFVGTSNFNTPALSVTAGTFAVEYSTLGVASGTSVVTCANGGAGSSIRNSIALTYEDLPEVDCDSATVENVFVEADATEPFTQTATWFVKFPDGDFHIAPNAPAAFTDPLSTFATWTAGDPRVDIDGHPRVNIDGQADYAGADVPDVGKAIDAGNR